MLKLGEKIKSLRKQRNISQESFAKHLGISYQAVSKWETGSTMPDITLIPAIASFFGISTDELFDYNLYMVEKNVESIVVECGRFYRTDKSKSEQILRDGLKQYPGNEILLNCLIGVIPIPERSREVIELCKSLIECTHRDEIKYDSYRILAEAYKSIGEYSLAKEAIECIPEIYFSKLSVAADLLEDSDMFEAAQSHKRIAFCDVVHMYERLADYYEKQGDNSRASLQLKIIMNLILAVKEDCYHPTYSNTLYELHKNKISELTEKIESLNISL